MPKPGDILTHAQITGVEGFHVQKGMNFRPRGGTSVFLMSRRPNAPYTDQIEDEGRTLIYEGHDISKTAEGPDPKTVDQPMIRENGNPSDNAKFFEAAKAAANEVEQPEHVHVYEKIRTNVWVYNGTFELVDAWQENDGTRDVFKFKLHLLDDDASGRSREVVHSRVIPGPVKAEVWKRDNGQCRKCGSKDNLHFDHILPFSKGGTSLLPENIQILCARHNLQKSDRIA